MDEINRQYPLRSCGVMIVLMIGGIITLTIGLSALYDHACYSAGRNWVPEYPEAEIITDFYSYMRTYGVGTTRRTLYSEDNYLDVRSWYNVRQNQLSRDNVSRGGAQFRVRVQEAENGGSDIAIFFECARELDLSPLGVGGGNQS